LSKKPRSVFISIDMEGITGVVDWGQVGGDAHEYNTARRLMAGDLNAAIEGALEAGVEEVVVSDAHGGMKNLQPEDVHEAAYLIRGSPKPGAMMEGIGEGFDAALYVGYHAMKGTRNGVLAHTISGSAVDGVFINGRETGEFGLNAALAGCHGVPSVFIAGDAAVAAEAEAFVPGIHSTVVKWAVGRQSAEALGSIGAIRPFRVEEPVEVKLLFSNSVGPDIVALLPYMERLDGRTVRAEFDDYPTALSGLRAAIYLGGGAMRR
jgi:D-amino peptidase